jgi:hypothetical protein
LVAAGRGLDHFTLGLRDPDADLPVTFVCLVSHRDAQSTPSRLALSSTFCELLFSAERYPLYMEDEKQDETQIGVRMSMKIRDLIERAARKDHRAPATWMRVMAVAQARAELGGAPPIREPDDEEEATLSALREVEGSDPGLLRSLVVLGRAATRRPQLARVVKELAELHRADVPPSGGARPRKDPLRSVAGERE